MLAILIVAAIPNTRGYDQCGDRVCGISESPINCPLDCPSGVLDQVCDAADDGRCDPDCTEDPDCSIAGSFPFRLLIGIISLVAIGSIFWYFIRSYRRGMMMFSKMLLALFLVIFVVYVTITMISSRENAAIQRMQIEGYVRARQALNTIIQHPCVVTVIDQGDVHLQEQKGLLDYEKLQRLHGAHQDPGCLRQHDFLYTLEVEDLSTMRVWTIGLQGRPSYAERTVSFSTPVAVSYNQTTVHPGRATLRAYFGDIPMLYGSIKRACFSGRASGRYDIRDIKYEPPHFCVEQDCFFAAFTCTVDPFMIDKGNRLIAMSLDETLQVTT